MTPSDLASRIDHTVLKPEATAAEVDKVLREAKEHHFATVCVAPAWVARAKAALKGTGVLVCTVAGFPHGTSKPVLKAIEATGLIKDGADEVDVVAFLPHLADANMEESREELREFVRACRAARRDVVLKVIVESGYLATLGPGRFEKSMEAACRAVRESGCDFIKTSTGFHPAGGATIEAVRLMKKFGQGLQIKAAGGIRDLATTRAMLEAGADRLGMSASVAVLNELESAT
jgi:deoxyribose-phosphate aldolase